MTSCRLLRLTIITKKSSRARYMQILNKYISTFGLTMAAYQFVCIPLSLYRQSYIRRVTTFTTGHTNIYRGNNWGVYQFRHYSTILFSTTSGLEYSIFKAINFRACSYAPDISYTQESDFHSPKKQDQPFATCG